MSRHTLTILIVALVTMASFVVSYVRADWLIFSRAGALIVVLGVFLEYWPIIIQPDHGKMPFWRSDDSHTAARIAAIVVCIGTLIWGFGDLSCYLFGQCK